MVLGLSALRFSLLLMVYIHRLAFVDLLSFVVFVLFWQRSPGCHVVVGMVVQCGKTERDQSFRRKLLGVG